MAKKNDGQFGLFDEVPPHEAEAHMAEPVADHEEALEDWPVPDIEDVECQCGCHHQGDEGCIRSFSHADILILLHYGPCCARAGTRWDGEDNWYLHDQHDEGTFDLEEPTEVGVPMVPATRLDELRREMEDLGEADEGEKEDPVARVMVFSEIGRDHEPPREASGDGMSFLMEGISHEEGLTVSHRRKFVLVESAEEGPLMIIGPMLTKDRDTYIHESLFRAARKAFPGSAIRGGGLVTVAVGRKVTPIVFDDTSKQYGNLDPSFLAEGTLESISKALGAKCRFEWIRTFDPTRQW